jgi:hypothetical protein
LAAAGQERLQEQLTAVSDANTLADLFLRPTIELRLSGRQAAIPMYEHKFGSTACYVAMRSA